MKPDWDWLAENADPSVFIADVNCQVETDLCSEWHPGGNYPTIMVYGKGEEPQLYQGGRGQDDLIKFVDRNLVPICDLSNMGSTCNEKEQRYLEKWNKKGSESWEKEVIRLSKMRHDSSDMTYDLSKWMEERIRILKQLQQLHGDKEL